MSSEDQSVAADVAVISGPAAISLTVSILIERYMAAYGGRDPTRPQRLLWWQSKLGVGELKDVTPQPSGDKSIASAARRSVTRRPVTR